MSPRPTPAPRRWLDALLLLSVLLSALALRTWDLGARPMHADEANQAVKLGLLIESGTYAFDPHDHHGPALYFFGLVPAWLRGESTLAALRETTVRLTPALAGTVGVGLLWLLARPWGPWPAFTAALLLAVSAPAAYYSRYFIQETLLVTFTLGALVSAQGWWRRGGAARAAATGACFGLMLATKSSAILFAIVALLALFADHWPRRPPGPRGREAALAGAVAAFVAALFYSSFGGNPAGLLDAVQAPGLMLARVTGGGSGHEKPWWYYASLLVFHRSGGYLWDQTLLLLPALVGGVIAARQSGRPRFAALSTAILALVLSATPYKTPWLVVGLYPGLCALASFALSRLRAPQATLLTGVVVLGLGGQTRQAVFLLPADPRNPFAYAHTAPDMKKVPALAKAAPPGPVKVIATEYWPLPWYLRARPETGYWARPPADCDAALVFAEADQAERVRSCLHGEYREGLLGLRPGVLLVVFTRSQGH